MLCNKCGKNEAVVYIKNILNGEKTEQYLCEGCANEQGYMKMAGNPFISMNSFFEGFNNAFQGFFPGLNAPSTRIGTAAGAKCPICGSSAADITRTGRAGCADCYTQFEPLLGPAIKRIHGDASHTGRVPGSAGAEIMRKRRIGELKRELDTAIKNEEFENAAKLRDEIRGLENGGVLGE